MPQNLLAETLANIDLANDNNALRHLPHLLREVAEATDITVALQLAERLGGQRIRIAPRPAPESKLALAVGHNAATAIAAQLTVGGEHFEIPRFHAKRRLLIASAKGTNNQIAAAFGVTQRYVRMVKSQMRDAAAND